MFQNKIIFITGGNGNVGNALMKKLLEENVKKIIVYSNTKDTKASKKKDRRIRYIKGDILEQKKLSRSMKKVDYVFHLAAIKQVEVCEQKPIQAINVNLIGTQNVFQSAIKNNIKKVITITSDKAVYPNSIYGFTKAIVEHLSILANKQSTTRFCCFRSGNILGTKDSVVPIFIKLKREQKPLTITDEAMTRFSITMNELVSSLLEITRISCGGEIFVKKIKSLKLKDLVDVINLHFGNYNETKIIGKRPGEKTEEELFTKEELRTTYDIGNYLVILPEIKMNDHYDQFPHTTLTSYKSSDYLMTKQEIEDQLREVNLLRRT